MIRRFSRAAALCCALSGTVALGGCFQTGGSPSATPSFSTADFLTACQTAGLAFCAVEPTAATIAALVTANPALTTADLAAKAFCALVTPKLSAMRRTAKRTLAAGPVDFGSVVINGVSVPLQGYAR